MTERNNAKPGDGTNRPIPDTEAPRRPAEQPTPVPTPQPVDPSAPVPAADQAQAEAIVDDGTVPVQRSGGGADNVVARDQAATEGDAAA